MMHDGTLNMMYVYGICMVVAMLYDTDGMCMMYMMLYVYVLL